MKPSPSNSTSMISVTIEIPTKKLKPYEDFGKKFHVPASHVLEAEVYTELEAIDDQLFTNLEWIDENCGRSGKLKSITLEFSQNVHALISRVAHLLRRTAPEFLAELAISSSGLLVRRLEDAKTDLYELEECVETLKFAREFHERAKQNGPPIGPTNKNGWSALGVSDPSNKKEVAA